MLVSVIMCIQGNDSGEEIVVAFSPAILAIEGSSEHFSHWMNYHCRYNSAKGNDHGDN
jgi:hypothetical protein